MKRNYLFLVLALLCFLFCFNPVFVKSNAETSNNLAEFLEFEQKIINLNNHNEKVRGIKTNDSNMESMSLVEEDEPSQSEFSLKRLIVNGNVSNTFGAIDKISYKDLHILVYSTESETEYAFHQLSKNDNVDVVIDKVITLEEYAEVDYSYDSYKNWGAEAIDVGGYRKFLDDNSVQEEVVVVVLDTGINTSHTMFSNRLLYNESGRIKGFSYHSSTYSYSYQNLCFDSDDTNKYSFEDDDEHGTHVAGIICDLTPENVKILPIKIGNNQGKSNTSIIISAYLRVINIYSNQYNVVCTNLSFSGGGKESESERDIFNANCYEPLLNKNILSITAAGNENEKNDIENLKAVVVSALEKQNNEYLFDRSYSNYGKIVDISAPGSGIVSAGISSSNSAYSGYITLQGTSMAAPQVAGAVALLYLNPNLSNNFTALDIEQMLYDLAIDMGQINKDIYYGHGMVNLKYFEIPNVQSELQFYKNSQLITDFIEYENFEDDFTLSIECLESGFDIIYTTDKSIPTLSKSQTYLSPLNITETTNLYVMGVKMQGGEIVGRTQMYAISYFDKNTPIDNCFSITSAGCLLNYTGKFTHLTIPSSVKGIQVSSLASGIFQYSDLQSVVLPITLTTISSSAFKSCEKLKFIYAPKVHTINRSTFSKCVSLSSASNNHPKENESEGAFFPELSTLNDGWAFNACESLRSVSFPKLVNFKNEKKYNFQSCSNLASVYLPKITEIPEGTFQFCSNLTGDFLIGEDVQSIGNNAFYKCKIDNFLIHPNNAYFYSDNFGVYSKGSLVAFACGNEYIDYTIKSSVQIGGIQYNITKISDGVMSYAKLDDLTIPESIISIGKNMALGSIINTLYYSATNCSKSGYFIEGTGFYRPFNMIDTIIIGSNVEIVPGSLFRSATFNNLYINSNLTEFGIYSLYCYSDEVLTVEKIVFNFDEAIDQNYLRSFVYDSAYIYSRNVAAIYSKQSLSFPNSDFFNEFIYEYNIGEYYIYSKEQMQIKYQIVSSAGENGSINPNGYITVNLGADQTFTFTPDDGYIISNITVDNVLLQGVELENAVRNSQYTFFDINTNHTIHVSFKLDPHTKYTVKHWQESLTQTGATLIGKKYYNLIITDTSKTGATGELTQATANTYAGFTAQPFEQKTIVGTGSTTIDILYNRNTYNVNLLNDSGINTVSGAGNYLYDQTVTLSADLIEGYDWLSWESSNTKVIASSSNIGYLFKMPANDVCFTAKTKIKEFTITISTTNNGSINPSNNQVVNYGSNLELEFGAYFGYELVKVLIDNTDVTTSVVDNKYTILNITQDHTVTATFDLVSYSITAQPATNGTISPNGSTFVKHGNNQKYTFTANTGYHLASITIDGNALTSAEVQEAVTNGYTFSNVVENHTISATFAINTYTITADSESYGEISPNGNVQVNYGDDETFTFNAYTGYQIDKVYVDGVNIGSCETYTFNDVCKDHTIYVRFSKLSYTISASSGANGSISPERNSTVLYGEDLPYTFIPNAGYKVKDVKVNGISVGAVSSYLFTNVISNQTIFVEFEKINLIISVLCGSNGTISPSSDVSVEYGGSKTFEITPNEGYVTSYIQINGEKIEAKESLVVENVTENLEIKIGFAQIFLISAVSDENGSITESCNVELGGQKRFDFTPKAGYEVKDVKIDNVSIGAVDSYLFFNVDCAHTISVEYAIKKFNIDLFVDGQGSLICDKSVENIEYGEDRVFTISAEDGWELLKVYVNGRNAEINSNQLIVSNIDKDNDIQAIFRIKQVVATYTQNSNTTIAIIIGTAICSILLLALLIKAHKNAKTRKIENSMQNYLNKDKNQNNNQTVNIENKQGYAYGNFVQNGANQTQSNPMLPVALNFAQSNQSHFISYCNKYNIDYINNYSNAVLRYYEEYLRSTYSSQPPKNDNN